MIDEKKQLFSKLVKRHTKDLNAQIFKVAAFYLGISITWNSVFVLFDLPYSRANLSILLLCMGILLLLTIASKVISVPPKVSQQIVLVFVLFIIICLYFGSGYSEAWSFFLFTPLISGLYGNRLILILYSMIGLALLTILSISFPIALHLPHDGIDISNRILVYIIVVTFSYILLNKLFRLYNKQVNTVVESMETTIEQVVQSFIIAVEAKDQYTFGHSERVSQYAVKLAEKLPEYQDEKKLKLLHLSGLVHDIGKINIPENILTKPDRLTAQEFEVIKTHTVVGAQMVEKIVGLEALKDGVLYHHERWDGTGYPTQAKGEEIPLDARILAIADAFDAMTSSRAYRDAMPPEKAFQRLEEGMGTQFDPQLREALHSVKNSWFTICEESHDELAEFETLSDFF